MYLFVVQTARPGRKRRRRLVIRRRRPASPAMADCGASPRSSTDATVELRRSRPWPLWQDRLGALGGRALAVGTRLYLRAEAPCA